MPARKILISWHITIFAVHAFYGDIVFLFSYHMVGRANFVFFTFTQEFFVHFTIFIYFNARHLLKNIFHYDSVTCPETLAATSDVLGNKHNRVRRSEINIRQNEQISRVTH
jgi:hypothetical protein